MTATNDSLKPLHDEPLETLEKGGNRIGSPSFEGGFKGIELELEATPPTLKYARNAAHFPALKLIAWS